MDSLEVYWEDPELDSRLKKNISDFLSEEYQLSRLKLDSVNHFLSNYDEEEYNFGKINHKERELRIFEIKDEPFCKDPDIYLTKSSDLAVKDPPKEADYFILDKSETEMVKFLPIADIVASIKPDTYSDF